MKVLLIHVGLKIRRRKRTNNSPPGWLAAARWNKPGEHGENGKSGKPAVRTKDADEINNTTRETS